MTCETENQLFLIIYVIILCMKLWNHLTFVKVFVTSKVLLRTSLFFLACMERLLCAWYCETLSHSWFNLIAWLCEVGHVVDILRRQQLAQEESLSKVTRLPGCRAEWSSPQSVLEHLHRPQKKPQYLLAVPSHFPQTLPIQPSVTTNLLPVSVSLPVLDISYKWHHAICGPLCFASFTLECNVFKVHPCCSAYYYFISFYCGVIFHCTGVPHFVYPFFSSRTFGLFPLSGYDE